MATHIVWKIVQLIGERVEEAILLSLVFDLDFLEKQKSVD